MEPLVGQTAQVSPYASYRYAVTHAGDEPELAAAMTLPWRSAMSQTLVPPVAVARRLPMASMVLYVVAPPDTAVAVTDWLVPR